jgi:hypothetical protein
LKIKKSISSKREESTTLPPPDNSGYAEDCILGKRGFTEVYDRATLESWLNADILQEVSSHKKFRVEEEYKPLISVFVQPLAPAPP